MARGAITLDNFANFHDEVRGVEIRSHLPFESDIPSTDINVRLDRIARAARIGHLNRIAFREPAHELSADAADEGIAADAQLTTAPSVTSSVNPEHAFIFSRGSGTVAFSLDSLFRTGPGDDPDVSDAETLAGRLNSTIGEGVRACTHNQFVGNKAIDRVLRGLILGSAVVQTSLELKGHGVGYGASGYVNNAFWYNVVLAVLGGKKGEYTLVPGLPYDRMGLVQAYTRNRKLVEAT